MQTYFSPEQLAAPRIAEANDILRTCVHCGFCTATCPTYVLLGDELDSPRGRISLMKEMLEQDKPATAEVVTHIDRCLGCLACMTTCPSGVNYMHLLETGRAHMERTYRRPLADRLLRGLLGAVMPSPRRFRIAVLLGRLAQPFAWAFPRRLRAMLELAPARLSPPAPTGQVFPAAGQRRLRVALLAGCVQRVVDDGINAATIRILNRHGVEVVTAAAATCCGALNHHMGQEDLARAAAAWTIRAWIAEADAGGLDAIVINTSGCGTVVKDYGHQFRGDAALARDAGRVSAMARDITEFLTELPLAFRPLPATQVAYHSACSLQHGQRITAAPVALLRAAGFEVMEPADSHLCCGSAGTYNLLQPELAGELGRRKAASLAALTPDVICAGNIGCMVQIGAASAAPVVHTAELLDWATGGPRPPILKESSGPRPPILKESGGPKPPMLE